MEEKATRHIGVIESFDLEYPDWPVITPEAKGTVRSARDNELYDLLGKDFARWKMPLVGVRISFIIVRLIGGRIVAGDIRREDNNQSA